MVRKQELIEAVVYALQQSDAIPDTANFTDRVPNIDTEPIKLPVIQVSPGPKLYISDENTDFSGFERDEQGNVTGKIYESLYTLEIMIAVWTAQGSQFSPREINDAIRDEMIQYETSAMDNTLVKPDGTPIDEVWRFAMQSGEQTDDFSTSPTLRRWEQTLVISASEQYIEEADSNVSSINVQTEPTQQ
jgi:hypothetical protein